MDFVTDTKLSPALKESAAAAVTPGVVTDTAGPAVHPATEAVLKARQEISSVYDFALEQGGLSIGAEPIWRSYISFLQAAPAENLYETSQKRDALRRAYQRAVRWVILPCMICYLYPH